MFWVNFENSDNLCITASGNILAGGNLCFRVYELQFKVINKNVCYLYSVWVHFFYKYIRVKGLGSDMLKVTQNIGWKYTYDMLIPGVQIFKMGGKSVGLSHIAYIVIHKL